MIPSPEGYYSKNCDIANKSEFLREKQMMLANQIRYHRDEDESNFSAYLNELEAYLNGLSLSISYTTTPWIDNDTPDGIAPTVTYQLLLDGAPMHTSTKNWQTSTKDKMDFLQAFLQLECSKTIHTMECVKSLEAMPTGAATRRSKI